MTNVFRLSRVGIAVITCSAAILRAETQADWPQWRGPDRNGICPDKVALADSWPATGLKRIWVSEEIPSGETGGYGSPVVADGQVFLYVNEKYSVSVETRKLPGDCVRNMGWLPAEKLPPTPLLKMVEEARVSDERDMLKAPKDVNPWADQWIKDHLTDLERTNFSAYCTDRLRKGRGALAVEDVNRLATLKDKLFASQADFEKALDDNAVTGAVRQAAIKGVVGTQDIGKDVVYCLSAADGKTVWRKEYDKIPGAKSVHNASSCTPCIAHGKVIVAGGDGGLYCLSAMDGSEQWTVKFSKGNHNGSPLVLGDLVIVPGQITYAFKIVDGRQVWQQATPDADHNSPVVWNSENKNYLICNSYKRVRCLDAVTGAVLWDAPGGSVSTAVISGDIMVVQSSLKDLGLAAYRLSPTHAEKLWSVKEFFEDASPFIYNGFVYNAFCGRAFCVSVADGHIAWEQAIQGGAYACPVLADGKLYKRTDKGMYMLRASPDKFQLLAKDEKIPTCGCTSPAITNGRLYIRQIKNVACYDLTGTATPPAVAGASTAK